MKSVTRVAAAAAAVSAIVGVGTVVAPEAAAQTRTTQVLEFKLDPITTQLVGSDPARAAASLARTSGGSVLSSDAWFALFTFEKISESIRSNGGSRTCVSGSYELSSSTSWVSAGWVVESSCNRVVPEFRQVTRRVATPDDGSRPLLRVQ